MSRDAALAWLTLHGWEVTSILPSGRVTIARGQALYRARSPEEAVRVLKVLVQGQDPAAARRVIRAIEGRP